MPIAHRVLSVRPPNHYDFYIPHAIHNNLVRHSVFTYGVAEVIYRVGDWTYPPNWLAEAGYHLTGFGNLDRAIDWYHLIINCAPYRHKPSSLEIWECEVGTLYPAHHRTTTHALAGYGLTSPDDTDHPTSWPDGTIFTDRIKLIRKIEELA
jgi:hypothetical protein